MTAVPPALSPFAANIGGFPAWYLVVIALLLAALYTAFAPAIDAMLASWQTAEFSHGTLIPLICAYLIWQRRDELRRAEFTGSWLGLAVAIAGTALAVVGRYSALFTIQHIALLVILYGLVLSLTGWPVFRMLAAPLGVLIFMIPLPSMLMFPLSSELQLISSAIGVWLMRLVGVATFLEGNVIDLGAYKLEVAEACSGLRYLLPLMTLAFLLACFMRAALWQRALLFLSSIPITLAMNSLRIAAIGVMVDRWGPSMAAGLLHEVQGWMVFMLSTATLLAVATLLVRLGRQRRPWREAFALAPGAAVSPARRASSRRRLPGPALASTAFVMLFMIGAFTMPEVSGTVPERESFVAFPLSVGHWSVRRQAMDKVYLDQLKLDDYLLADFVGAGSAPVNLYVAWYDRQSAGEATHSPKACIPGGGWRIEDLRQVVLPQVMVGGRGLRVNRALIQYDAQRELVYYWFLQRGRVVTNEYLVKWYLLVDSITRHRTDGALVRVIMPITPASAEQDADRQLQAFIAEIAPRLARYVPD